MAEFSGLWTTGGATGHQQTSYSQAQLSIMLDIAAACATFEGVALSYRNELVPSDGGANTLTVASGGAIVDGKFYDNDASLNVNIPNAGAGLERIDRVVARADWANFKVTIVRIAGSDATPGTAVAPSITQTPGTTYDIQIAQVLVDDAGNLTVTDERNWAAPEVDGSTLEIDQTTGQLQAKNDGVTNAKLRNSVATSVIGRSANSAGDPADIQASSNDTLLRRVSNALGFGQLTLGMIPSSLITEAKLAAAVIAQLVTNGDSHDHSGGDGAQIPAGGLATDSVTAAKIAAGAVGSSEIAAGAVDTSELASDAVSTAKIQNSAVTADKIANRTRSKWFTAFDGFGNGAQAVINELSYIDFDFSTLERYWVSWHTPEDFVTGNVTVKIHWFTLQTSAGNVVWQLGHSEVAEGETWPAAVATTETKVTTDAPDDSVRKTTTLGTFSVTAGDDVALEIARLGADGGDTFGDEAYLYGVEIEYTADS